MVIFNNYSPKAKQILSNNPQDEVEGIIRQYSLSLRRINYCFSIIAQVIIRAIAISFILFLSSSKTSRNHAVAMILKIIASGISIIITLHGVIIARYDVFSRPIRAHASL